MNKPSQQRLKELLNYDPKTGDFVWKVNRGRGIRAGDKAGYISFYGYRLISIDGKQYKAHRLAFLYVLGSFPDKEVDHIDHQPDNNAWDNLRPATRSQNNLNRHSYVNKSSGIKGVSWHKAGHKWQVRVQIKRNVLCIGLFEDIELAQLVAEEAREKYHGKFAWHK